MAYVSLLIALTALALSMFNLLEARRFNRIQKRPHLVDSTHEDGTTFTFKLQNKGGGPAYLDEVMYFKDGRRVEKMNLKDLLRSVLSEQGIRAARTYVTNLGVTYVMGPGESVTLIQADIVKEDWEKVQALPDGLLGIRIAYHSVFGEPFVWETEKGVAQGALPHSG